jgi:endogenous inhibitor of DNA gyrase (YacG/DUF329 family)
MAIVKLCPMCGKSHTIKRITKIYCSPLCRQNALNARKRELVILKQEQQPETQTQTQ